MSTILPYYLHLKEGQPQKISDFLAERLQEDVRSLIVTKYPEKLMTDLVAAWRGSFARLIVERDNEQDITYMAALSDYIALMQNATFSFSEFSIGKTCTIAHPSELHAQLWENRQILLCYDDYSLLHCLRLRRFSGGQFQILASVGHLSEDSKELIECQNFPAYRLANHKLHELVYELQSACSALGVPNASGIVTQVDALHLLIGEIATSNHDPELMYRFRELATEIASMRIACGRLKPWRSVGASRLKALKIITGYLTTDATGSGVRLFDDPYGTLHASSLLQR